ncbi:MAG: sigma-70 family RNA polymerase sigma factor [Deltaproteobacteria bacterium]|nr:sigma-70 family RNA polymerase sigma factor [Deltaproteobacteria bacterium]
MLSAIFALLSAALARVAPAVEPLSPESLRLFHDGDAAVLAALFRAHAPRAVALMRRKLPGIDAEAAVQEAFVNLLSSAEQRRRFGGGSFAAFLCTLARCRGIDAWRREQRYVDESAAAEPVAGDSGAEDRLAARELLEKFWQRSVPPTQKDFFRARFIEQQTQLEAADRLQIKRSTLATWEKRLAERLRRAVISGEIAFVAQG